MNRNDATDQGKTKHTQNADKSCKLKTQKDKLNAQLDCMNCVC